MSTRIVSSVSLATLLAVLATSLAIAGAHLYRGLPSLTFGLPAVDETRTVVPAEDATAPVNAQEQAAPALIVDPAQPAPAVDLDTPGAPVTTGTRSSDGTVEAPYNAPPLQKNVPGDGRPMGEGDQSGGPRGDHKGGFDY